MILHADDRFTTIEDTKPCLFPTSKEVLKKTGIQGGFFVAAGLAALALYGLSLPLSSTVTDPSAVVIPLQRTDFASPKAGFVTKVVFKQGDEVKKGDLLLKIESPGDKRALEEAVLETAFFKKELQRQKTEAKIFALKSAEAVRLKKLGVLNDGALKEAELLEQAKRRQVESAMLKIIQAGKRRAFLEEKIVAGEIRAPFDGRVISDPYLKENSYVKEGDFLLTLASRGSVLEFLLKESDYTRVSQGSRVRIKFYAFPGKKWEGHVAGFRNFAEALPHSGISQHGVKALILWDGEAVSAGDNAAAGIQNGMSAKITIEAKPQSMLEKIGEEIL